MYFACYLIYSKYKLFTVYKIMTFFEGPQKFYHLLGWDFFYGPHIHRLSSQLMVHGYHEIIYNILKQTCFLKKNV